MSDDNAKTNTTRPEKTDEEEELQTLVQQPVSAEDAKDTPEQGQYYIIHPDGKHTCHRQRTDGANAAARKKLIIASILCLIFMAVEVVGGVLSNSLAIASDAAHVLIDFAGFMISLFAIWLAGRKATDRLTFGWYRAEIIGALASIMTIWSVTAVLIYLAIERCIKRDFEVAGIIMLATAAFGVITNIALGVVLLYNSEKIEVDCDPNSENAGDIKKNPSRHGHGHSHDCGLKIFEKVTKKIEKSCGRLQGLCRKKKKITRDTITTKCIKEAEQNINIRAAFLHVLGDCIQSIGVLIAGIIIYFRPDWAIIDPICTFLFAILVLLTTIRIMKDILLVLMEGTPSFVDYKEVQKIFEQIEGVKSVHGLRVWALNVDRIALTVHLVIGRHIDPKTVLDKAEDTIHKHYNLYESTIQIEQE